MRSDRYWEAVGALDAHRREREATPTLFAPTPRPEDPWLPLALEAIRATAAERPEVTVEDVAWPSGCVDRRARGIALQEATRRGWLRPLGYVSGGRGRHGRPIRLYASTIVETRLLRLDV